MKRLQMKIANHHHIVNGGRVWIDSLAFNIINDSARHLLGVQSNTVLPLESCVAFVATGTYINITLGDFIQIKSQIWITNISHENDIYSKWISQCKLHWSLCSVVIHTVSFRFFFRGRLLPLEWAIRENVPSELEESTRNSTIFWDEIYWVCF